MLAMIEKPDSVDRQVASANTFIDQFSWRQKNNLYLAIVDRLIPNNPMPT
jgi:hypothetical protein